jgi:hypothetical protein
MPSQRYSTILKAASAWGERRETTRLGPPAIHLRDPTAILSFFTDGAPPSVLTSRDTTRMSATPALRTGSGQALCPRSGRSLHHHDRPAPPGAHRAGVADRPAGDRGPAQAGALVTALPLLLFLPVARPRPAPVYARPGTGYQPPELSPEPPQATGAAPPLRFRTGADRFRTAQPLPGPPD